MTSELRLSASEHAIQSDIRLTLGLDPDVVLWRNNVGLLERPNGGRVRYGLAVGSSDLIGMVTAVFDGHRIGRFLALEVKRPGERATKDQLLFLRVVQARGGVAAVVSSPTQAVAVVEQAKINASYRGGDLG